MPLVIIDGPEAAGKTTIIDALLEAWGPNSRMRRWGPRKSWLEYCGPLFEDTEACREDPHLLIVWSRSWLSRSVYNKLLNQGQDVPPRAMTELDRIVLASGGLLFLVQAPVPVLKARRQERLDSGSDQNDHPISPKDEAIQFSRNIIQRKWRTLSGVMDVRANVQSIITLLVQRNPECRMDAVKEEPIAEKLKTLAQEDPEWEDPFPNGIGYTSASPRRWVRSQT